MNTAYQLDRIVVLEPARDGSVAFLLQALLVAAEAVLRQRATSDACVLQSAHRQSQAA